MELCKACWMHPERRATCDCQKPHNGSASAPMAGYPAEVIEVIEHAARLSCHCQMNAKDCEINRHWPSCIVGKAQKLLGAKVTIKAG